MTVENPWRVLRFRDDVLFDLADLPDNEHGRWYPGERVVLLAKGLTFPERRVALAHELGHVHYGDHCTANEHVNLRQEQAADVYAARWLIDLEAFVDARRWSADPLEIAGDLQVTPRLLAVRLDHLHPSERGYLRAALADEEAAA